MESKTKRMQDLRIGKHGAHVDNGENKLCTLLVWFERRAMYPRVGLDTMVRKEALDELGQNLGVRECSDDGELAFRLTSIQCQQQQLVSQTNREWFEPLATCLQAV